MTFRSSRGVGTEKVGWLSVSFHARWGRCRRRPQRHPDKADHDTGEPRAYTRECYCAFHPRSARHQLPKLRIMPRTAAAARASQDAAGATKPLGRSHRGCRKGAISWRKDADGGTLIRDGTFNSMKPVLVSLDPPTTLGHASPPRHQLLSRAGRRARRRGPFHTRRSQRATCARQPVPPGPPDFSLLLFRLTSAPERPPVRAGTSMRQQHEFVCRTMARAATPEGVSVNLTQFLAHSPGSTGAAVRLSSVSEYTSGR